MLDNQPCKIIDLATSKPGKHGTAKVLLTGVNIFSGKRIEVVESTGDKVMVPIVKKYEL